MTKRDSSRFPGLIESLLLFSSSSSFAKIPAAAGYGEVISSQMLCTFTSKTTSEFKKSIG